MLTQRAAAVILGGIMIISTIGFALTYQAFLGQSPQQKTTMPNITTIMERELTSNEKLSVLRSGGVIIEARLNSSCLEKCFSDPCAPCQQEANILENFALKYSASIVLSKIASFDENAIRMISGSGSITEITNVTDDGLLDAYCSNAVLKPRECLLKEI
ncbi:MAG: thioredoxin family protein [Candidatus Aenigmarchaeota archaeon]|nr:thioredoxin family protein [Candidatus Aenigmarchaeota archaeon]